MASKWRRVCVCVCVRRLAYCANSASRCDVAAVKHKVYDTVYVVRTTNYTTRIAVCGSGIAYIALVYSSRRCIHIPSIHSFVRSFVRYSHDFSCCLISNFYLFLVSSPFFSLHYLLYDMAKCLRASRLHTLHIYRARITAASNLKKKGDDDDEDEARTEKQK